MRFAAAVALVADADGAGIAVGLHHHWIVAAAAAAVDDAIPIADVATIAVERVVVVAAAIFVVEYAIFVVVAAAVFEVAFVAVAAAGHAECSSMDLLATPALNEVEEAASVEMFGIAALEKSDRIELGWNL